MPTDPNDVRRINAETILNGVLHQLEFLELTIQRTTGLDDQLAQCLKAVMETNQRLAACCANIISP